jgi:hypothetical protein
MLFRLFVAVALLFAGVPATNAALATSPSARDAVVTTTTPVASSTTAPAPKATVTERDVVVPAVTPAAAVVESPDVVKAQADSGVIVTDKVVAANRVESPVVETGAFQTVGVTWPGTNAIGDLGAQVRTRVNGAWTAWVPLATGDSPDTGSADGARAARGGTDPVWVGDADAVQLSFAATAAGGPKGLSLALVGSPEVSTQAANPAVAKSATGTASIVNAAYVTDAPLAALPLSALAAPRVITRAEWGAAPQACTPDVASTLVGAVLHHTADPNTYSTVAQAMQQIRNDQAYHINSRGWCDIGYNFLVDKWGNIYEGRADSMTKPVVGAHAGGFNTGTVGIAMLGTYSDIVPSAATQEAVAEVIAWRLSSYGRNPSGQMSYYTMGGEGTKIPAGTTITLPVVFGHRDVGATACPGNGGYSILPGVRVRATALGYSQPLVKALYHDMMQRDVDPSGMQTWTSLIYAGVPPSSLGDSLARSQEYVQRRVVAAYQEILRRDSDPTGFASWTGWIMSGSLRVEDLRGQLIASDEYYAKAGGTDQGYIGQLYRDILHREAGPSEVAYWVANIQTAGRSAASVGVWRSLESANLRVNEVYGVFLDRAADPSGIATWGPYWQAHGEDALRGMIVGSDEYLARATRLF